MLPNTNTANGQLQAPIITKNNGLLFVPPANTQLTIQPHSLPNSKLVSSISSSFNLNSQQLAQYFNSTFFKNRQLNFIIGKFDQTPVLFAVLHPVITENKRLVFLLLGQTIENMQQSMSKSLLSTMLKYIFVSEPTEQVIMLIHKTLTNPISLQHIKSLKYFKGNSKSPLALPFLGPSVLSLGREDVICKKEQEYFEVLSMEMYVTGKFELPEFVNSDNIYLSSRFLNLVKQEQQHEIEEKDYQQFSTGQELKKYLQEE